MLVPHLFGEMTYDLFCMICVSLSCLLTSYVSPLLSLVYFIQFILYHDELCNSVDTHVATLLFALCDNS